MHTPVNNNSQGAAVNLPEIPTLEVYRPMLETIESVPEEPSDKHSASGKGSSKEQVMPGENRVDIINL